MRIFSILLIVFSFLFISAECHSQQSFLFLKKGRKKVRTWYEGDVIRLELKRGGIPEGRILLLRNDTIYMNDLAIKTTDVKRVLIRRRSKKAFPINAEQAAWIAGGVALTTVGLRVAKWETNTGKALLYSSVIGFGPILITALTNQIHFRRKDYPIGKKFRLQVLDFYVPQPVPGNKAF